MWVIAVVLLCAYCQEWRSYLGHSPRELTAYCAIVAAFVIMFISAQVGARITMYGVLPVICAIPSLTMRATLRIAHCDGLVGLLLIGSVGPMFIGPRYAGYKIANFLHLVWFCHIATVASGVLGIVGIQMPGGEASFGESSPTATLWELLRPLPP